MGCQISKQDNNDIVSIQTQQQFKLSYRELICQDRGQVFQLYHFSTIINRSNYSIVRKVTSRASSQNRICKIIPLANRKYFSLISQFEFLKKLDHPNIIQIIQYFLEPSFLYIITEQIPGDRILNQLHKSNKPILFSDMVEIMSQLLKAVEFCHQRIIAHRTITTQNVMLFWKQSKPIIKLIDFSQACTIGSPKIRNVPLQKRNIIFEENLQKFVDKIDIYDCGIILLSLLSGKKICNKNPINYQQMIDQSKRVIQNLKLGKKIQRDLLQIMSLMLSQNPKNRPSALQCLNHEFFKNFNKNISSRRALECLIQYQSQGNLQFLLNMYTSLNMMSVLQKAEYLSQFYYLDKNKDGQIQFQELVQGIKNTFNVEQEKSKDLAEHIFTSLDKNKSGTINFSQYITGTLKITKLISNDFLQKMFLQIDLNKDGYISQQQVNNLIIGIDRFSVMQSKKQINFKQFKQIMNNIIQKNNKMKQKK